MSLHLYNTFINLVPKFEVTFSRQATLFRSDADTLTSIMGNVRSEHDVNIQTIIHLNRHLTELEEDLGIMYSGIHLVPMTYDEETGVLTRKKIKTPHALLDLNYGKIHVIPDFKEKLTVAKSNGTLELDQDLASDLVTRGVKEITISADTIDPEKLKRYTIVYHTYYSALKALHIAITQRKEAKKGEIDKSLEQRAQSSSERSAEERANKAKKKQSSGNAPQMGTNARTGKSTVATTHIKDRRTHAERMNQRMEETLQKGFEIRDHEIDKQLLKEEAVETEINRH